MKTADVARSALASSAPGTGQEPEAHLMSFDACMPHGNESVKSVQSVAAFKKAKKLP